MTEIVDLIKIEFEYVKIPSVWTDVTADVLYPIEWVEGMADYSPLSVTASPGLLTLAMDNGKVDSLSNPGTELTGAYSPGRSHTNKSFTAGLKVRLSVEWQGFNPKKFEGRIAPNGINPTFDRFGSRITVVRIGDFFEQASKQTIILPDFAENKTLDQVITLLVAQVPTSIQPGATNFTTGISTFPFVFDTVRDRTSIRTEMNKATLSEFGYIYLTHDSDNGDILTVESRTQRIDQAVKKLTISNNDAGFLLLEDGNFLLLETGGKIVLNRIEDAMFDNIAVFQPPSRNGKFLTNRVSSVIYPRSVDTNPTTVLFCLQSPIKLDANETRTGYRVTFRDPAGAAFRTNGRDLQVFDTDSLHANTSSDASGSDVSSSLVITGPGGTTDVSDIYGTEGGEYTLANGTGSEMWVTTLDAVGKGVYLYDPVQYVTEDTNSQDENGIRPLKFNLYYQDDPNVGKDFSDIILDQESYGRNTPESPVFSANSNSNNMSFFVNGNIGDKINFKEDQQGFDNEFFVQGMKVKIDKGNIIHYSLILKEASSVLYWRAGTIGRGEAGVNTIAAPS